MAETTAKLRDLVKQTTGFDIMLDDDTFKSTYDIIIGIGKEYQKLSDIEQAGLLEALAGKRQSNVLAAALNNIKDIEAAYEAAEHSSGSALEEQKKYEASVQYSLDRLKASLQEMSLLTIDSGLIKDIVDLTNGIINLINTMGGLSPILITIGGIFLLWKTNLLPSIIGQFKALALAQAGMIGVSTSAAIAQLGLASAIKAVGIAIKTVFLSNPIGWAILATSGIFLVGKVFDAFTESSEEAEQKLQNSKQKIAEINNEISRINESKKTFNDLAKEFEDLSNNTNKTAEEMERFYEVQNQIKEILPSVNGYYDEQGNFIIDATTKYADLNAKIEEYLQLEREKKAVEAEKNTESITSKLESSKEQLDYGVSLSKEASEVQSKIDILERKIKNAQSQEEKLRFASEIDEIKIQSGALLRNAQLLDMKGLKESFDKDVMDLTENVFDRLEKYTDWNKLTNEYKNAVREAFHNATAEQKINLSNAIDPDGFNIDDFMSIITVINPAIENTDNNLKNVNNTLDELSKRIEKFNNTANDLDKINKILDSLNKNGSLSKSEVSTLLGISEDFASVLHDEVGLREMLNTKLNEYKKNHNQAYLDMVADSDTYYDSIIDRDGDKYDEINRRLQQFIDDQNIAYKVDLKNYTTIENAKLGITKDLITKVARAWEKYLDPLTGQIANPENLNHLSQKQQMLLYEKSKQTKALVDGVLDELDDIQLNSIDLNFRDDDKKKEKDTWKEAFQAEYNYIKYLRDSDKIDAQQYYDKLNALNQKYFANRKKYLDEYRQYDLELYKLDQELAEDRIKDWEHTLTLKINAQGSEATKGEQIRVYTEIQNELHRLAEEGRKRGLSENSDYLQSLKNQWWDYAAKIKSLTEESLNKQISLYEKQISAAEKVHDLTVSMEKKKLEIQKKSHEEVKKAIKDEFDLKKSLLDNELDKYEYNKQLQEKVDAVNKIQGNIDLIKNDDTQKGRLKQLEDELTKAMGDLNDFQYKHGIDVQKKIYDEQEKNLTDKHQAEIDAIDEKLNDEVYLRELADKRIKESGSNLYNDLMKFSEDYGTVSKHEINEVWKAYETVSENFDISQNGLISTLDTLYDKLANIKDLLSSMDNMSLGEFTSFRSNNIKDIISQMEKNSKDWYTSKDKNATAKLNDDLARQLKEEYGLEIERRPDGHWYDKNTGKRVYHTGGIVSDDESKFKNIRNLRNDEVELIAQKGELILSKDGTSNLFKNISGLTNIAEKLSKFTMPKLDAFNFTGKTIGEVKIENTYYITEADKNIDNKLQKLSKQVVQDTIKQITGVCGVTSGNIPNIVGSY